MYKGESIFFTNTVSNDELFRNINKQSKFNNSLPENALLKSSNSTCGNMEVINLI